ncbi:MAG: 50S ribosomal protein L6 [Candidatus Diapherotrites archaeon]|nr:50S ribosomal protein L6 [Candidatus Micrarchaeota archaeon]MBU1939506.1 50S ribosomal protein L6 [Candidatus Micrarchaeota archaeon]
MAKVMEKIVAVPAGFNAEVNGMNVSIKKGDKSAERTFKARNVKIEKRGEEIMVTAKDARKKNLATANTIASHIRNMITGLEKDYVYRLEVVFSHFPMNIAVKGNVVEINNLAGAKQARISKIMGDTKVVVKGKDITVSGSDKEAVGQTAANFENVTKVKGKDIRIFQDGIYIVEKPKTGAAAVAEKAEDAARAEKKNDDRKGGK